MENWQPKHQEQQEASRTELVIQALEALCSRQEQGAGRDFSHTRDLLARAYPESFTVAKHTLEGKT